VVKIPENLRNSFVPGLPVDDLISIYLSAPGDEVSSGKFTSPESSAALAANVFGFFLHKPYLLPLIPDVSSQEPVAVKLEALLPFPWNGGRHPCLDALISTKDSLIGIESKRFEPFRLKQHKVPASSYRRDIWGSNMYRYRKALEEVWNDDGGYRYLDVAQLVKHAFGLRTAVHQDLLQHGKQPILVYLFSEPRHWPSTGRQINAAEHLAHQNEIDRFCELVAGDEVKFVALSYSNLIRAWGQHSDQSVRDHIAAIVERYPETASQCART